MVSYRALLHLTEAAVHGPVDSKLRGDLLYALQACKDDVRDLLAHNPPRAADRAQVVAKEVRLPDSPPTVLDDQDVEIVLKLSRDLHLNEVDCVALLVATHQEWSIEGRDPLEVVRLAAGLWMTERRSLLTVLHIILRVVVLQGEVDPDLAAAIGQYVQELMGSGVRSRMLALLRELNREEPAGLGGPGAEPFVMDVRGSLVLRQNVVQRERLLLAQCLVYAGLIVRINSTEAVDMFNLLKDCAADWSHHHDPVKLQIAYTILFALINALVSDSLGSALDTPPLLAPDASFRKQFQHLVMAKVPSPPFVESSIAVIRLAWAVFLSNTKEYAPAGTAPDEDAAARACLETSSLQAAFKFLTDDILGSATYQNTDPDLLYLYTAYLHKLLCCFLTQPLGRDVVQVIKDEAVNAGDPWLDGASLESLQNQPDAGSGARGRLDAFVALLRLVGDVYFREPELMVDNAALWTFVLYAGEEHRGYATMAAFLDLLTALATGAEGARQVYRLLQERAFKVISWETLFHTLVVYDQQFRQSMQTTGAVLTPFPPGDARALEAYLRTMKKVMEEGAEDERTTWFTTIEPLFRLLQYEVVPTKLKGALRDVIRAFVPLGPDVSDSIWSLLDAYELPVMPQAAPPTSGSQQLYDMSYELNEVEARTEEYPSTISYVLLVNALIAADATQADQGRRYSRFFEYIRDQVFLPYAQRAYADASEKWQLVAACLANFEMMLKAYQPEVELQETDSRMATGPPSTSAGGAEPPSGQELMKDFMSGRAVYRNVMSILSLGADAVLEERGTQQHGVYLEDAVRLSLRLLSSVLSKDSALAEEWRPSCLPLDAVLRTDSRLLVTVLEFVRYDALPEVQRLSVQLMAALSSRIQQLVPILVEEGAAGRLTEEYAACLEAQLQDPQPPESSEPDTSHLIMQLLLGSLDMPAPNVAHMLLSFDLSQAVERSSLQPKRTYSCLRVLLDLLEAQGSPEINARVHEMAYELLYALCTDPVTSGPTTELLRSPRYEFFVHHVERVACQPLPRRSSNQALRISNLQQRAWLLKILAFALHVADTDIHQQQENCQRLLTLLFLPGALQGSDEDSGGAIVLHDAAARKHPSPTKPLILELLDLLLFQLHGTQQQASPEVQAFQQDLKVNELVESQATVEEGGIYTRSERGDRIIDIEAFKEALLREYKKMELAGVLAGPLSGPPGPSSSQMADRLREAVQASLKWAWKLNWHQQEASAQLHLLLAWCQLVEVTLSRRYELLDARRRPSILFGILDASLEAMDSADCSLQMALPLSQVVMTLVAKLQEQSLAVPHNSDVSDDVTWIDLLTRARLPTSACHSILSGLVRALLRHETSEALRRRLYATLVSYLNYSRGAAKWDVPPSVLRASLLDGVAGDEDSEIERVEREQAELVEGNYAILKHEAAAIVDLAARDAAHGSELGRALAYSALGALVAEDAEQPVFMSQLQSRGLLQACLADLSMESYRAVLFPSAEAVRKLYLVGTQLSLLLRVSHQQRPRGAAALFSMGALRAVAQCRALDVSVADADVGLEDLAAAGASIPSQRERHHQVVAPLLRLVYAITGLVDNAAAPGSKGQDDVVVQACQLVHAHEALFSRILLDASPTPRLADLEELELATAILSRVWPGESISERSALEELVFHLAATYFVPDSDSRVKYVRHILRVERAADIAPEARAEAAAMEESLWRVRGHVICYLHVLVSKHGTRFNAAGPEAKGARGVRPAGAGRQPTLRLLSDFLRQSTLSLFQAAEEKAVVLNKIEDLNELPRHEVEDLIKTYGRRSVSASSDSTRSRRLQAMVAMGQFAASKEKQVHSLRYVVEHILEILLIHYQTPRPASTTLQNSGATARLSEEPGVEDVGPVLGSRHEMEDIGRRLTPSLDKLESVTEEKAGHHMQHVKRLIQRLKSHIFSSAPGASD